MKVYHFAYRVWRRSGRSSEQFYRLKFSSPLLSSAMKEYQRIADGLRQGAVVFVGPDGVVAQTSGPALRTRW